MSSFINSNIELVNNINTVLKKKKNSFINIVNNKLTFSVFSLIDNNLSNVKYINFLIRDTRSIPSNHEVSREFQIDVNPNDMIFNSYDIIEKNKLKHLLKRSLCMTLYIFSVNME